MDGGPFGYWYLNGHDIWLNYNLAIKKGTADFLQYAPSKDVITNDWPDQHGLDIDTTSKHFKERTITLQMWGITETEDEFWLKHDAFITELMKPGTSRITITAFQSRSYFVIFKSCSNYEQVPKNTLRNIPEHLIVHQFSLVLLEPQPQLGDGANLDTFIAADNGEFLIV